MRFTMMQLPKKGIIAAYGNILCILEKKKKENKSEHFGV